MARKLGILAGLLVVLLAALGLAYRELIGPAVFPPLSRGRIIDVYVSGGGPAYSIRFARVSVAADGTLGLEADPTAKESAALGRALDEARDADGLRLKLEAVSSVGGKPGRAAAEILVDPDDPRYPWAVLDHLRSRGLAASFGGSN